jgi:uncharacterized membrane protein
MSRDTVKTWLNRVCTIGAVLYPLLAHLSIYFKRSEIAAFYLLGLFVIYLLGFRAESHWLLRLAIALLLVTTSLIVTRQYDVSLWLYVPPILIPLWAALVFLASLRHPNGGVISRIATMMEGEPLDAAHRHYTDTVTLVWGIVLLGMVVEACALAGLTSFVTWSWWVYIGNYFILFALVLIELPVRWLWLGKRPQLKKMFKVMLRRPWQMSG